MARIRNQKQSSSTKPLRWKKPIAKPKPDGDSTDEENLVTGSQETDDVSVCTCIHPHVRFSSQVSLNSQLSLQIFQHF